MIEINARLSRGPVYFATESLKCVITFRNVNSSDDTQNNYNYNSNGINRTSNGPMVNHSEDIGDERLCWAVVQIHCYATIDETRVLYTEDESSIVMTSTNTSFNPTMGLKGDKGRVLFASTPKIIFCDLTLSPSESKSFVYFETIPDWVPPSYNGFKIKYQYKLSIGTQRVNSTIQLLRIPIRVLTIPRHGFNSVADTPEVSRQKSIESAANGETSDSSQEPHRKDSIVSNQSSNFSPYDSNETVLDLSLHRLDCLTAKRCPQSYFITNQLGKVAKFCMVKSTYKLGEEIVGMFYFTESTVPCVQFSVTLQSDEVIEEEYRAKDMKTSAFTQTTSYGKYHDFCLHMNHSQMILSVPLTVTPTFQSQLMSLSWKLHFEFVTSKPEDTQTTVSRDSQGVMEQSPGVLNVQTMVWDLPICIYATHPIQVARGFQLPATSTLTV